MSAKAPTKKQLAARKLFAQRSRAGTLKPIGRVSQATGKRPSARLKARREKSIPGYFANPIKGQKRAAYQADLKSLRIEYALARAEGDWDKADRIQLAIDAYREDLKKPKAKPRKKNPLEPQVQKVGRKIVHFRYLVETRPSPSAKWRTVAGFHIDTEAAEYAHALNAKMPGIYIHVEDCE